MTGTLHPYIKEAADRYGTCVRYVMDGRHFRTHRERNARCEIWQRLRADGFSYPAIGRMTNADHSSVHKALAKQRAAFGDGVSGD